MQNTTRTMLFAVLLLVVALQLLISDELFRIPALGVAACLLAYLWKTSKRQTKSTRSLALTQIALSIFATVGFWSSLNLVRDFTYESIEEGPDSFTRTSHWYADAALQPPGFWIGVGLASSFAIVLIAGFGTALIKRYRISRSYQKINV